LYRSFEEKCLQETWERKRFPNRKEKGNREALYGIGVQSGGNQKL